MFESLLDSYRNFIDFEGNLNKESSRSYIVDVKYFLSYLENKSMDNISKVNKTLIIKYLMDLEREGLASSTISRRLSSLKSFGSFLVNEGYIDKDPTLNLKGPKLERIALEVLSVEEVDSLMEKPDLNKINGLRDRAMLELLYSTGIEIKEIVSLDIEDIDLDLELIRIKNDKDRVIPIGSYAKEYLDRYLEKRETVDKNSPLFLNNRGKRLSRQGFWKSLKKYEKLSNIKKPLTPKILRQSFAVHMLENGADLELVQKMLGHTNMSTTQVYAKKASQESMRKIYRNSHPRA